MLCWSFYTSLVYGNDWENSQLNYWVYRIYKDKNALAQCHFKDERDARRGRWGLVRTHWPASMDSSDIQTVLVTVVVTIGGKVDTAEAGVGGDFELSTVAPLDKIEKIGNLNKLTALLPCMLWHPGHICLDVLRKYMYVLFNVFRRKWLNLLYTDFKNISSSQRYEHSVN